MTRIVLIVLLLSAGCRARAMEAVTDAPAAERTQRPRTPELIVDIDFNDEISHCDGLEPGRTKVTRVVDQVDQVGSVLLGVLGNLHLRGEIATHRFVSCNLLHQVCGLPISAPPHGESLN